ncbi:YdcF family protein [Rhodanobacter sp. IGA1.0]|uniref:YdcF family protein n=1 Tax=Rhodanobacter sp. IGA1.0 TaxID=3158582 RepID=A0AAU7QMW2_9GAMM
MLAAFVVEAQLYAVRVVDYGGGRIFNDSLFGGTHTRPMTQPLDLVTQLSYPSQPLAQVAVFWAIGILCVWRRRYRYALTLMLFGMAWLALCSTPTFSDWLRNSLESRYAQREASAYPVADAIVILGGARVSNDSATPPEGQSRSPESRTGFGFLLFQHAKAPYVLLSGGNGDAAAMAAALETWGVEPSALILETRSLNTHQNAKYVAAIMKDRKLRRILLVTSSIHMPRAVASFKKEGVEVTPAPALDRRSEHRSVKRRWRPATVLLLTGQSLKEYCGMLYYRLRGWL